MRRRTRTRRRRRTRRRMMRRRHLPERFTYDTKCIDDGGGGGGGGDTYLGVLPRPRIANAQMMDGWHVVQKPIVKRRRHLPESVT